MIIQLHNFLLDRYMLIGERKSKIKNFETVFDVFVGKTIDFSAQTNNLTSKV